MNQTATQHPQAIRSGDRRLKYLDREMAKYNYSAGGLMQILYKAMDLFGYLPRETLRYIAHSLQIPASKVFGTASFYPSFILAPRNEFHVSVCSGTTCHLSGANILFRELRHSAPKSCRVTRHHCTGLCGHAPVVHVGEATVIHANAPETLLKIRRMLGDTT